MYRWVTCYHFSKWINLCYYLTVEYHKLIFVRKRSTSDNSGLISGCENTNICYNLCVSMQIIYKMSVLSNSYRVFPSRTSIRRGTDPTSILMVIWLILSLSRTKAAGSSSTECWLGFSPTNCTAKTSQHAPIWLNLIRANIEYFSTTVRFIMIILINSILLTGCPKIIYLSIIICCFGTQLTLWLHM